MIQKPVGFADDCVGDVAAKAVAAMKDGDILCLENTRFHKEEEKNDPAFVAELAKLGDIWVNDAFSAAHRAHASTEGLGHKLPAYAGRTMQAELDALGKALEAPARPVIAIIGGAKVSTKIDLLENLVSKVDALVIGGGMANTFLHAQGVGVGKSLAEKDLAATALRIIEKAETANCAIILPVDAVVAFHFAANSPSHAYGLDAIPSDGMILDVGPQSVARIHAAIDDAKTLVWNGPLGAFEMTPFDRGTMVAAKHAAERTKAKKLVSVAGGGDTVAALNQAGVAGDFSYVSTAGGAFLEWMEGKPLPGVEVLKKIIISGDQPQRGEQDRWLGSRCANCSTTRRSTTTACRPSTSTIWSRRSRSWRPPPAWMRPSSSRPRAARAPMPTTSCSAT